VLLILLEYWCAAHEKEECSTIHLLTTVDTFLCYGTLIPYGKLNWHLCFLGHLPRKQKSEVSYTVQVTSSGSEHDHFVVEVRYNGSDELE
jgi:hypothetical protein